MTDQKITFRCQRTEGFRIDTITHTGTGAQDFSPEREARVLAHINRVQKEQPFRNKKEQQHVRGKTATAKRPESRAVSS